MKQISEIPWGETRDVQTFWYVSLAVFFLPFVVGAAGAREAGSSSLLSSSLAFPSLSTRIFFFAAVGFALGAGLLVALAFGAAFIFGAGA